MRTIKITPKEEKTLLDAIECLIQKENDTISHTKLTLKIMGKVEE